MQSINIISLNIEQDWHLENVVALVQAKQVEVILLQEVLAKDLPYLQAELQMQAEFAVLNYITHSNGKHNKHSKQQLGLATLSKLPILKSSVSYYRGDGTNPPHINKGEPEKMDRAVLAIEVVKSGQRFCLLNTHFTWSADGKPSELQYHDLAKFLLIIENFPEFVLGGDFNAPRGTAIFDTLATKFQDNIPREVNTTLDKNLHIAGYRKLVVDGLFTTPAYQVNNIEVVDGISDHCAIVAAISKNSL